MSLGGGGVLTTIDPKVLELSDILTVNIWVVMGGGASTAINTPNIIFSILNINIF